MRKAALLAVLVALTAGCDAKEEKKAAIAPALPPFQQEIASVRAEVTLPGAWKYGYRIVDRPDTAFGAQRAIEFLYSADSASGVPPRLLMVIRQFKKPVWEKQHAANKSFAKLLAEHGNDVYAVSMVGQSPYPPNSKSTLRVDAMMIALTDQTSPFGMTFRDSVPPAAAAQPAPKKP